MIIKYRKEEYLIKGEGDFKLSPSGTEPSYFDIKSLVLSKDSELLVDCITNKIISFPEGNSVVGIELGGALIASRLAYTTLNLGAVRKKKRNHALMKQIEGKAVSPYHFDRRCNING